MATLEEDLARYADELYTTEDVRSGIGLILTAALEVGGAITIVLLCMKLLAILSGALAAIGLTMTPLVAARLTAAALQAYTEASAEDRRQIRAAMTWINGGFSLGERFLEK